jgi:Leucine-rich repeat (LRR) protein
MLYFKAVPSGAQHYWNTNNNLNSFPNDIPLDVVTIGLTGNILTSVSQNDCKNFTELKKIYLEGNKIMTVSAESFNFNPKLNTISFQGNPIELVPFFPALTNKLKYLYIQKCNITSSTWDMVVRYTSMFRLYMSNNMLGRLPDLNLTAATLQALALTSCGIKSIPTGYFDNFTSLRAIYLAKNGISQLDESTFRGLVSLKELFLDFNNINMITSRVLRLSPDVTKISLKRNKLDTFDATIFKRLPLLNTLYLSENNLTTVENPYAGSISNRSVKLEIFLHTNPMKCDQDLCWVKFEPNINFSMDDCLGKSWADVTIDDLCPSK